MSAAEEHRTAYEVLGVPRDATAEEVRRAYRRGARAAPPPRGGGHHPITRFGVVSVS